MNFLEFSQILVNITVSIAALIMVVFVVTVGNSLIRVIKKIEHSVDAFKKGSSEIREKVTHFFNEISLVSLGAKVNSWFNKSKKNKKL